MSDPLRQIRLMLEKHARTMRNTLARGVLRMAGDGTKMQTGQIEMLEGEMLDGAERPQPYGFSSHPHPGAEVIVGFLSADRSHGVILQCDDRRYRVKSSKPGEVSLYTDEGDRIDLKRDNTIEVTTKHLVVNAEEDVVFNTKEMTINAQTFLAVDTPLIRLRTNGITQEGRVEGETPEIRLKGDVYHEGNRDQQGDSTQTGSHASTGDQVAGGVSQMHHLHTGVQPGGGNTGEPEK